MAPKAKNTDSGKEAPRSQERGAVCVPEPERYLDDKELTFCIEYSVSGNATSSYQRAYKCGYNTANAQGYKMLSDIVISTTIDRMRLERLERLKIDKDDFLRKVNVLFNYDSADYFDDDGRLKPLSELHPDARFVIEGMDVSEKVTGEAGDGIARLMKIRLPKKKEAAELLAKCMQWLNEKPKEDEDVPKPTRVEIVVKDARTDNAG